MLVSSRQINTASFSFIHKKKAREQPKGTVITTLLAQKKSPTSFKRRCQGKSYRNKQEEMGKRIYL